MTAVSPRWEGRDLSKKNTSKHRDHQRTDSKTIQASAPDVPLFELKQDDELNHTQISGVKL